MGKFHAAGKNFRWSQKNASPAMVSYGTVDSTAFDPLGLAP